MDLEFTVDTDHRKRRRNRTTQSCLNCHTSKRKCDRKRPCQRCIQLGLTGLCVYEIDDPALRDDPTVDESTRLRNRIAELESLVRELRGKPHPRWADTNFRDGDPNEKWHSRATKCAPLSRRGVGSDDHPSRSGRSNLPSPIKTEPPTDAANPNLYRFSPSPAPPVRYHGGFDVRRTNSNGSFESNERQQQQAQHYTNSPTNLNMPYPTSPNAHYNNSNSYAENGNSVYAMANGSDGGSNYSDEYSSNGSTPQSYCPCRNHPTAVGAYMGLAQQLQNSLRQYNHPPNSQCLIQRRIVQLNDLLQHSHRGPEHTNAATTNGTTTYDSSTPSDNELLTPLSASSGSHAQYPNAGNSPGMPPQEWSNMATGGYNPYFPMSSNDHHAVYSHVMT